MPADLVIIGLGVTPATEWLDGSGLRVDDGVVCDATGAVEGGTDIVAAGDVARWWHPLYERHLRVEHWDHAGRQGAAAARNLLAGRDAAQEYDEVPYFWSDQYDVKVQMLGVPTDYDALRNSRGRSARLGSLSPRTDVGGTRSPCWERYRGECAPIVTPSEIVRHSHPAHRISAAKDLWRQRVSQSPCDTRIKRRTTPPSERLETPAC